MRNQSGPAEADLRGDEGAPAPAERNILTNDLWIAEKTIKKEGLAPP